MSIEWDGQSADLDPVFAADLDALLKGGPASWRVEAPAFRSIAKQDALYAQGRTTPGEIVTQAKGGQSPHNWGLAVDVCRLENGRELWDYEHPDWAWLRQAVDAHPRLHGGWHFPNPDNDHIQSVKWPAKRAALIAAGTW